MKASSIKTWHWIHKWTSLVCTIFALLLCITGLPLIFTHEIDRALGNTVSPPVLPEAESKNRASVDEMVADARKRHPGHFVQFVSLDDDEENLWYVRLGQTVDAREASAVLAYDGRTGKLLTEYPLDQGVMNVFIRLHIDMFAGLPGMLFLGAMGLVLVASIVSGVVLYGPYMQKLAFGAIRRRRAARILWLDIHNLLGIVTLGWFTVVSLTGVVNTLSTPIFGQWQATHLAEMIEPYRHAPPVPAGSEAAQRALDSALEKVPNTELGFMAFPGNSFAGPHHFVAFLRGNTPWTSKLLKPVLLDAENGTVLDTRELPAYVSALLVSQPLHFGDYGGMPLKIVWVIFDLASIVVLGSGVYLWLRKRNVSADAWRQSLASAAGGAKEAA
ncbi:putative iron-regulated membrane protein [Labilithrix luteola]|uniref:Putative iron-regulated membrane protein n=1 Tax=Labilithrix luteola TaxID=1391654 RepID=A0A0K1QEJ0_9BACT|nr:PepSY domain-containing protein [Labilithrix luteola]AKV04181.1 putative iron-regulated membrane protein [Labilithrix luteola]